MWRKWQRNTMVKKISILFYERFSRDSLFQQERLHEPLYFVTADPEDEFQILETTLEPGQWFAFRPPDDERKDD